MGLVHSMFGLNIIIGTQLLLYQFQDDIDIIYMTGDLVPHNIWYSTQEDNTNTIRGVSKVLYDYFPGATVSEFG